MARQPTPWRRGAKGPWYAQVKGQQVWLAPPEATKSEAQEALDRVKALTPKKDERRRARGPTFYEVANLFLIAKAAAVERKELKPLTLEGYQQYLVKAADALGRHPVAALKPLHVNEWLDAPRKRPWNTTTRNNAITAVKACLNWARREGHVPANPIADMAKPAARVTESDLTEAVAGRMIGAARDRPFRDFMEVAFATGARPSEIMAVTAADLDFAAGLIVMDGKTTGRTGRDRVIVMGSAAATLARLAAAHPEGPVFRNARGTPWTRHTLGYRFRRVRRRLGLGPEATAKGFRHGFATDALSRSVPIATVAELLGHAGTGMVSRHYSKLRKRQEHLKEAARAVRPGRGEEGGGGADP